MAARSSVSLAAALVVGLLVVAAAQASCIFETPAEQRARADVIFDGVALEGRRRQGFSGSGGSVSTTSVSLFVRKGERWRIFARGAARGVLRTNVCDGSRKL